MGKVHENERGFSAVEVVLVVVIVALIGVVGYMMYKNHHKAATVSVTAASNNKPVTKTKATTKTTTTASTPPANPYAGWTAYTTKYLHASFKYPASWKLDDSNSNTDGDGTIDDMADLTAPDGFTANVSYGNDGACASEYNSILYSRAVTVDGVAAYLDFYSSPDTPNDVTGFFLSPKNAPGGGQQLDHGSYRLCVSGNGVAETESVTQAQSDPDYADAVLLANSVIF